MKYNRTYLWMSVLLAFLLAAPITVGAVTSAEFLQQIQNADPNIQAQAVERVFQMDNSVVLPLCKLMADTSRSAAQSAWFALEMLANHRARPAAAVKERQAFNDEMLKFLKTSAPKAAKQRCLRLVAVSAGKKEAETLGKYLRDAELFEPVRWALEAIPVPEAGAVLVKALKKATPDQQAAILSTLGTKKYTPAAKTLLEFATNPDPIIRTAAYSALVRLPEPAAGPILLAAAKTAPEAERERILQELMKLADNLTRQNQVPAAISLYEKILELPIGKNIELGVVHGFGKFGTVAVMPMLLNRLESECGRTRQQAASALATLPDPAATDYLIDIYKKSTSVAVKAALLTAITARDPQKARPLVLAATNADEDEIVAAAFYNLADVKAPEPIKTVEAAIAGGPESVRKAAYHASVKLAEKIQETDPDAALNLYHLAVADEADLFDRRDAMYGITEIGNPASIEKVKPLLYAPQLSQEAASFYFQMAFNAAFNHDLPKAEELLLLALGVSQNQNLANSVLAKMKAMGFDQTSITAKIGFIPKWWVAGPFSNKGSMAEKTAYFPEKQIDFNQTEVIGDLTASWKKIEIEEAFGILQFGDMYGRHNLAGYAYSEIVAPENMTAVFKIGSNDGVACWLNGEKIHQNFVGRGLSIDSDVVNVQLQKGVNRILCKVLNEGGNWQLTLRVCDEKGVPLDLSKFEVLPEKK
jgi:HEAT repeat protein